MHGRENVAMNDGKADHMRAPPEHGRVAQQAEYSRCNLEVTEENMKEEAFQGRNGRVEMETGRQPPYECAIGGHAKYSIDSSLA